MRERLAERLETRLVERGIRRRDVQRLLDELGDHYDDLVAATMRSGVGRREAERRAERQLGATTDIERAVLSQPALRSWAWRWPWLASVVYPAAWLAALPLVPVLAGMRHAESIVRWMICIAAGAVVTVAMLLLLQLSIWLA